jgi:hypothetical protein
MSRMGLAIPVLAALVALVGLASPVAAAELVDVTGTVRNADGSPAAGVEVLVGVAGSDVVQPLTTDAAGAFATQVEASVGDTIDLRATGATVRTAPDTEGCTRSTTRTARASLLIEALQLPPVVLTLDTLIESETCAATGKPGPNPTPPPTDSRAGGISGPAGGSPVFLLGLAWIVAAVGTLTLRRRA